MATGHADPLTRVAHEVSMPDRHSPVFDDDDDDSGRGESYAARSPRRRPTREELSAAASALADGPEFAPVYSVPHAAGVFALLIALALVAVAPAKKLAQGHIAIPKSAARATPKPVEEPVAKVEPKPAPTPPKAAEAPAAKVEPKPPPAPVAAPAPAVAQAAAAPVVQKRALGTRSKVKTSKKRTVSRTPTRRP
jgi:hypothetical protein